jgi:Flp pilus assembly protein TadG
VETLHILQIFPRSAGDAGPAAAACRGRSRRSGYVLIATSFGLVFLLGVAGLSIDIGRMYLTKSEAQAYVDAAAMAAAKELDDTSAGVARATAAVGRDTDKWRFETAPFSNVSTTFATSSTGPFTDTPPDPPTGYTFVRVVASVDLPMYLIRMLSGPTAQIAASAVAGRSPLNNLPGGVFPFSPFTRTGFPGAEPDDTTDPYGFKVGNQYTLRWGAPGNSTTCGTDATAKNLSENDEIR